MKKSITKKLFIKICKILGYEIIDQNEFYSPTLNKAIAMAYVSSDQKDIGNKIYIKIRKKLIKAKVVSLPFVK